MYRLALSAALAIAAVGGARAQDVPFAAPPRLNAVPTNETVPALSDIMGKIQVRHIKLWHAMGGKNWPLLAYELAKTKDAFGSAVILYRNIPTELIVSAAEPVNAMLDAAEKKDIAKLQRAYADLTTACNSFHQAAQVPFIRIKTPTAGPFGDQKF